MTDLGASGGGYSYANAMNDIGQISGYIYTEDTSRAFLWENGTMTDLGTLEGSESWAYGINNSGGFDNITIRNCNIYEGNASGYDKHSIYLLNSENSIQSTFRCF